MSVYPFVISAPQQPFGSTYWYNHSYPKTPKIIPDDPLRYSYLPDLTRDGYSSDWAWPQPNLEFQFPSFLPQHKMETKIEYSPPAVQDYNDLNVKVTGFLLCGTVLFMGAGILFHHVCQKARHDQITVISGGVDEARPREKVEDKTEALRKKGWRLFVTPKSYATPKPVPWWLRWR